MCGKVVGRVKKERVYEVTTIIVEKDGTVTADFRVSDVVSGTYRDDCCKIYKKGNTVVCGSGVRSFVKQFANRVFSENIPLSRDIPVYIPQGWSKIDSKYLNVSIVVIKRLRGKLFTLIYKLPLTENVLQLSKVKVYKFSENRPLILGSGKIASICFREIEDAVINKDYEKAYKHLAKRDKGTSPVFYQVKI